jgi:hypothetical protein
MATFNKFESFVGALGLGYHGNLNTNQLNVGLYNDAPLAADDVLADQSTPQTGTGYAVADTTNTYSETGGTGTLVGTKVVWTAGAADWIASRYVVLYNLNTTTITNGLIGWWDYGAGGFTLGNGETFSVKFNGSDTTGNILTLA